MKALYRTHKHAHRRSASISIFALLYAPPIKGGFTTSHRSLFGSVSFSRITMCIHPWFLSSAFNRRRKLRGYAALLRRGINRIRKYAVESPRRAAPRRAAGLTIERRDTRMTMNISYNHSCMILASFVYLLYVLRRYVFGVVRGKSRVVHRVT